MAPAEMPTQVQPMSWGFRALLVALMLAIVAIWGWTFVIVKDAIAIYGVIPFLAVRFVIGSAALSPVALPRAQRRGMGVGALIGLVLAAAYLFQTLALARTTATNVGVITGLFVVFAPLANLAMFRVRTTAALWGAIGVSVLGLCLLTGAAPTGVSIGDVLAFGGALAFGVQVALLDRYAKRHGPAALAFGQVLAATAVFVGVWLLTAQPAWPAKPVWFALLITGLLATAAGFFVQTFVQRRLSAVETATIIVTEPIFAAVFAYFLARDRLTPWQLLGGALMVAAMAAVEVYPRWRARRRRRNGTDATE